MEDYKTLIERFFSQHQLEKIVIMGINIILIYILLMAAVYLERKLFKKIIERREKHSVDKTNLIFLKNVVIYTTYTIGFISMINQIPGLQQLSKTLLTGAGILAAAVGFGSQQAISNIVSGIFMVLFKPFRVGDHITLTGDNKGTVIDISLRHTTIQNSDKKLVVIPNSVLNNQSIINSSVVCDATCALVDVFIGYKVDINRAMELIQDEALKHPLLIETDKENVIIRVVELTKSSVNLRAWLWAANNKDAFVLKCDLLKSIKERFEREGVEIF